VFYLLREDALIAGSILGVEAVVLAGLFVIERAKALIEARRFFAKSFAISRSRSRNSGREPAFIPRFQ
jgi:hypothetical protein